MICTNCDPICVEINSEYVRQYSEKGYDAEHDDTHTDGELALAAVAYALPEHIAQFMDANDIKLWPFEGEPNFKNRRWDLVRAAALIVAEIARFDRMSQ